MVRVCMSMEPSKQIICARIYMGLAKMCVKLDATFTRNA